MSLFVLKLFVIFTKFFDFTEFPFHLGKTLLSGLTVAFYECPFNTLKRTVTLPSTLRGLLHTGLTCNVLLTSVNSLVAHRMAS